MYERSVQHHVGSRRLSLDGVALQCSTKHCTRIVFVLSVPMGALEGSVEIMEYLSGDLIDLSVPVNVIQSQDGSGTPAKSLTEESVQQELTRLRKQEFEQKEIQRLRTSAAAAGPPPASFHPKREGFQ